MNKRTLLIDDMRTDWGGECIIARNYWEGIDCLKRLRPWDLLLLDHDLASFEEDGRERTGYDVLLWIEANIHYAPKEIKIISSNPSIYTKCEQAIVSIYKLKKEYDDGWRRNSP